ncbi:hypothetical protein AZO1586I_745 [Bathymodiolus thermophilus thioautotrophic gill symbiont]|uniref:Transposase IS4-like domain-containing protein n=2 Tax=Bathymodiolus thermophilus thioautotrophic gill symbiont TaxID=2360 RepID=A0ABM8M6P0_9GAMM|nr:hypothetical protein AZO1586I_745 [Bathymodiolus thermophilus thioautotrophic gill symbiont]
MHANTDEDGFVKKMTYTPGNVHDSKEFYKLLGINKHKNKIKTCGEVYADLYAFFSEQVKSLIVSKRSCNGLFSCLWVGGHFCI